MYDQNNNWIVDNAEKELFARVARQATPDYWQWRALLAEAKCNQLQEEIGNLKDEKYNILHKGED